MKKRRGTKNTILYLGLALVSSANEDGIDVCAIRRKAWEHSGLHAKVNGHSKHPLESAQKER